MKNKLNIDMEMIDVLSIAEDNIEVEQVEDQLVVEQIEDNIEVEQVEDQLVVEQIEDNIEVEQVEDQQLNPKLTSEQLNTLIELINNNKTFKVKEKTIKILKMYVDNKAIDDIAKDCGFKSVSSVKYHINKVIKVVKRSKISDELKKDIEKLVF